MDILVQKDFFPESGELFYDALQYATPVPAPGSYSAIELEVRKWFGGYMSDTNGFTLTGTGQQQPGFPGGHHSAVSRGMKMKCPKLKKRYDNIGYLFVLPAFALFMIFAAVPACLTFRIAFYEWDFLSPDMTFVGVENFVKLFEDENFRTVIGNTFYFTVVTVLAKVGLGVILANFVASRVRNRVGQFVMESALFMPIVIPMSVVALVFNKMYDYEFGVLNGILRIFGLGPVGWLTDADIALNSVMLVDIFKGVGFFFIIALVAIRNIPRAYYEAAEIDGGTKTRQFFAITLPLIGNTLVFLS